LVGWGGEAGGMVVRYTGGAEPPYPVVRSTPGFMECVGMFRPSDYVTLAGGAAFGWVITNWSIYPTKSEWALKARSHPALSPTRWGAAVGLLGGLFYAYGVTYERATGWAENAPEVKSALASRPKGASSR